MPLKNRKLLLDKTIACEEIIQFTNESDYLSFQRDRLLQLAIEREFEIIGEALSRLARLERHTLSTKIPDYQKIIDFRNIIAHGYDIVDLDSLWDFAINRVPELLEKVQDY